jgi:hypothetical protein
MWSINTAVDVIKICKATSSSSFGSKLNLCASILSSSCTYPFKTVLLANEAAIVTLHICHEGFLVYDMILECFRGYLSFKHEIQLFVSSTFHFRNTEITPHQTWDAESTEEESKLATQISCVWVDQVRNCDSHDDSEKSLDGGCNGDSLRAYLRRADFTEDSKSHGSDAPVVHRIPHQEPEKSAQDSTSEKCTPTMKTSPMSLLL